MGKERLRRWVDERHLELSPTELADSVSRFTSTCHLVLGNFLRPKAAAQVAGFLAEEAEFEIRYGLYSARPKAVSEARWQRANDDDRFYRHRKLSGARDGRELSTRLVDFLRLRRDLYDSAFRHLFESLTGLALGALGPLVARAYEAGDYLRPHTDDAEGRQLALILYLAPAWRQEYGGSLHLTDPEGRQVVIGAEYNSAAVFDVTAGSEHWVAPISAHAAARARLTLSGWFARPGSYPPSNNIVSE